MSNDKTPRAQLGRDVLRHISDYGPTVVELHRSHLISRDEARVLLGLTDCGGNKAINV